MEAIGKVDQGKKRAHNEDAVLVSNEPIGVLPNLYIVADGMGGHKGGAIASQLAIDAFCEYVYEHATIQIQTENDLLLFIKRGIVHANHVIYQQAKQDEALTGMGTTMTVCICDHSNLYIAHVGDTRVYILNEHHINQVTVDHSWVQEMHDKGFISRSDMQEHPRRNVITRAVGTYEQVKVDTIKQPLAHVKYILLCSDGLTSMLDDGRIHQIMTSHHNGLAALADQLIAEANAAGGKDNIGIIIGKEV